MSQGLCCLSLEKEFSSARVEHSPEETWLVEDGQSLEAQMIWTENIQITDIVPMSLCKPEITFDIFLSVYHNDV